MKTQPGFNRRGKRVGANAGKRVSLNCAISAESGRQLIVALETPGYDALGVNAAKKAAGVTMWIP